LNIVGAAGDPEPPGGAAAGARAGVRDGDQVARAIAEQRLAFLGEMGADQLARAARAQRQPVAGGVDDLGEQRIGAMGVQIVGALALACEVAQHLRHTVVGVTRAHAPGILQVLPELRVVQSGLAAEQPEPEAELARPPAGAAQDLLEKRRVGRRA
jgi:hypothetical protein